MRIDGMMRHVYGIEPDGHTPRHLPSWSKWMSLCIFVYHFTHDNTIHWQMTITFTNNSVSSHSTQIISVNIWPTKRLSGWCCTRWIMSYIFEQLTAQCWLSMKTTELLSILKQDNYWMLIDSFLSNDRRKFDLDLNILNSHPQQMWGASVSFE